MNKYLKWILIALLGFIVFIALSESIFKVVKNISIAEEDKAKKEKALLQKKQEEEKAILPETDTREDVLPSYMIDDINEFLGLVSTQKFEEAYNLLNPDFRVSHFPDLNSFINYCNKDLAGVNEKSLLVYEDYKIDENTYTCRVQIKHKSPEDPNIDSVLEDFITVHFMNDDKEFNLSMLGYIGSKEVNLNTDVGLVKLSVKRITKYNDNIELLLEVINGENQPVAILDRNAFTEAEDSMVNNNVFVTNEKGVDSAAYIDVDQTTEMSFTVNPNSTAQYNLKFYTTIEDNVNKINFENILIGSGVKKAEIQLEQGN